MRLTVHRESGFSLVEIALALGVAAFAFVTLIGLLGVSAETTAASQRDTILAAMTRTVLNDLRSANFDNLWKAMPREAGTVKPVTNDTAPEDTSYFFTHDGTMVPNGDVAANTEVTYECTVRKFSDAATRSGGNGPYNLLKLELLFTSPVSANSDPLKRPNRQTVHASIARY